MAVATRTPRAGAAPKAKRKRFGNRPVFRAVQVSHRWLALVLGVFLLVLVVTGCLLLFKTTIQHATHHDRYYPSSAARVVERPDQAMELVQRAQPKVPIATTVQMETGNWAAMNEDGDRVWAVDASTGAIVDETNPNRGFWALLDNIHECALSCEGYPLYWAAIAKPVGGPFGPDLTWAGLLLGVLGLVLLVLVVGGLFLWWPGIKRMSRGFKIRRGSRYKLNYDLHKVVGFVALPFLFMWAFTGANFELPFVTNLWYAALPGEKPAEVEFKSTPVKGGTPITPAQAVAAVRAAHPGRPIISLTRADPKDPTSAYDAYIANGYDPWGHSDFPGDLNVYVDQFSGRTKDGFTDELPHLSQQLEQQYFGPTHMGFVVNSWWRSIFLLFGLVPILLAVTGTTTWWIRRGKAKDKQRRRRERERAAAAAGGSSRA